MYDIKNLNIWKQEPNKQPSHEYLNTEISELNLSVRSYNCLKRAGCNTIGDIIRLVEGDENGLRRIRNLGTRSEAEILENVNLYKEQFCYTEPSQNTRPIIKKASLRSEETIWYTNIEEFYLSDYALTKLKQNGIQQVKDLYATNPKQEPGWYAVRELFEKITSIGTE